VEPPPRGRPATSTTSRCEVTPTPAVEIDSGTPPGEHPLALRDGTLMEPPVASSPPRRRPCRARPAPLAQVGQQLAYLYACTSAPVSAGPRGERLRDAGVGACRSRRASVPPRAPPMAGRTRDAPGLDVQGGQRHAHAGTSANRRAASRSLAPVLRHQQGRVTGRAVTPQHPRVCWLLVARTSTSSARRASSSGRPNHVQPCRHGPVGALRADVRPHRGRVPAPRQSSTSVPGLRQPRRDRSADRPIQPTTAWRHRATGPVPGQPSAVGEHLCSEHVRQLRAVPTMPSRDSWLSGASSAAPRVPGVQVAADTGDALGQERSGRGGQRVRSGGCSRNSTQCCAGVAPTRAGRERVGRPPSRPPPRACARRRGRPPRTAGDERPHRLRHLVRVRSPASTTMLPLLTRWRLPPKPGLGQPRSAAPAWRPCSERPG
jgi:hypothetical protein